MNRAVHVVTIAGGSGTRLWPLSRRNNPKFLSDFGTGRSLLAETLRRARAVTDATRITIVTSRHHAEQVRTVARHQGISSIIVEPEPRGTAAAVAAATRFISEQDASAIVVSTPADHVVSGRDAWTESIAAAVAAAESGELVCLGVRPTSPLTGFGYVHAPDRGSPDAPRVALAFTEKPDADRAEAYVRNGDHYWNTAIAAWRCDRFEKLLRAHAPAIHKAVEAAMGAGCDQLDPDEWARVPCEALEPALFEPAAAQGAVTLVPASFGWADVGSWDAVASHSTPTASRNDIHELDTANCFVITSGRHPRRRYALLGVEDLILVDAGDVVLVSHRDRAQDVKSLVEEISSRGWEDLL